MEGMKYGYARVSMDDQTPALQLTALKKAGAGRSIWSRGRDGMHPLYPVRYRIEFGVLATALPLA